MMTPRVRSESSRVESIRSRARAPIDRAIRVSTLLDALFARDGDDETWVAWIDDDDGRWVMGRRRRECATVCVCVLDLCARCVRRVSVGVRGVGSIHRKDSTHRRTRRQKFAQKLDIFAGFIHSFIHRTVDIRSGRDVIDDAHAVANDDDDFDAFDARVCGCG